MEAFLKHASQVYAYNYFGIILVVSVLEWLAPRRGVGDTVRLRWLSHVGLTVLDAVLVRILFPIFGAGWALVCLERGLGLFNRIACPAWLAFAATVVALDLAMYGQHWLAHRVPVLWRVHRTHHTDHDFDFTTGLRFHPLESVLTASVLLSTIALLGAPPAAVLVYQLLSLIVSLTEHADIRVAASLDRVLRLVVVTSDMHRIHHSAERREGQSNFAAIFSWWDRLFGTYLDQPSGGHDAIVLGVAGFEDRKHLTLPWMIAQPFLSAAGDVDAQLALRNRQHFDKLASNAPDALAESGSQRLH